MSNSLKLLALVDGSWQYVFCRGRGYNENRNDLVLTTDKTKALQGTADTINYFRRFFSDTEFKTGR